MEFKKALIHQNDAEKQATRTEETTEAVKDTHETLKELLDEAKSHASSKDLTLLSLQLDHIKEAIEKTHPSEIEAKVDITELTSVLKELLEETKKPWSAKLILE